MRRLRLPPPRLPSLSISTGESLWEIGKSAAVKTTYEHDDAVASLFSSFMVGY